MKVTTLAEKLAEKFKIETRPSEDFDGAKGGLWLQNNPSIDGLSAHNYYSEDYSEKYYVMNIVKPLAEFLRNNGYFAEFYDAGTVMIHES